MNHVLLLGLVVLSGCSLYEPFPAFRPSEALDDVGLKTDAKAVATTIQFVSPSSLETYTNGNVDFEILTTGPVDFVDLLEGDRAVGRISDNRLSWDTTVESEGSYDVVAVGFADGKEVARTEPRTIIVDRTPPTIVSRSPESGATNVFLGDPVSIEFSEVIATETFNSANTFVRTDDGALVTFSLQADDSRDTVIGFSILPTLDHLPSTFTVVGEPADRAGNAVADFEWSFEVPRWQDISPGELTVRLIPRLGLFSGDLFLASQSAIAFDRTIRVEKYVDSTWVLQGEPFSDGVGLTTQTLAQLDGSLVVVGAGRDNLWKHTLIGQQWVPQVLHNASGTAAYDQAQGRIVFSTCEPTGMSFQVASFEHDQAGTRALSTPMVFPDVQECFVATSVHETPVRVVYRRGNLALHEFQKFENGQWRPNGFVYVSAIPASTLYFEQGNASYFYYAENDSLSAKLFGSAGATWQETDSTNLFVGPKTAVWNSGTEQLMVRHSQGFTIYLPNEGRFIEIETFDESDSSFVTDYSGTLFPVVAFDNVASGRLRVLRSNLTP